MTQDTTNAKPIVLLILDGWGHCDESKHNPIKNEATPTFDKLFANYPNILISASGPSVGLPEGQMGNSEVGHLHLGSGRKVPQDLTLIDEAINKGGFFQNGALINALKKAVTGNKAVHILGLLSPGGVHSHEDHIAALIQLAHQQGSQRCYLHAFLDGRDTPPQSALPSLQKIDQLYSTLGHGKIASLVGRYYAMDRDKRWDRTQKAFELLTLGNATYHAPTAEEGLQTAYSYGEKDEFVKPISIHSQFEAPTTIADGDVVIFMNFRPDRARQLTHAFLDTDFNAFPRHKAPIPEEFVSLTQYAKDLPTKIAYPKLTLKNTLGECLSLYGYTQLRLAETEKYPHVTYFFNGGEELPFPNESRILIPSPKVATYDLQPEMNAIELTDQLVDAINSQDYDTIICNYANPDMVGHTGIEAAANLAVATVDQCIKRVLSALEAQNGEALITADHGNIEQMYDETTGQAHTAHTTNLVPLIYFGQRAIFSKEAGALDDVAPTLLYLLGLKKPEEMTGQNLLKVER
jgi:2,3-bisphosphoglycerate-independent phosphoglycerate mutase